MKGQFSRDSFNPQKTYSGVYQQQGRMLTDADWNEMVQILKQRMQRTVGGAIDSGSPRDGGILHASERTYPEFMQSPGFRWGHLYIDGLYGELRRSEFSLEVEKTSIKLNTSSSKGVDNLDWTRVDLASSHTATPVVIAAMQEHRDGALVSPYLRQLSPESFEVQLVQSGSSPGDLLLRKQQMAYVASQPGDIDSAQGKVIGEAGYIDLGPNLDGTWFSFVLRNHYQKPVVMAQLHGTSPQNRAMVQLKNITAKRFECRVEPGDGDGDLGQAKIAYWVVEQGQHRLSDNTLLEVGTLTLAEQWQTVSLVSGFTASPVIFSQIQNTEGEPAHRNLSTTSVDIGLINHGDPQDQAIVGYIVASANQGPSLENILRHQGDYPGNPFVHKTLPSATYEVYVDLWERLVVAHEDAELMDKALHGADTCVRSQTMVQVKLAPEGTQINQLPAHGNARLQASILPTAARTETAQSGNALFRLEVHSVKSTAEGNTQVVLKWSSENGAEERANNATLEQLQFDGFLATGFVYECFSTDSEKHLGQHLLERVNGWSVESGTLYAHADYLNNRQWQPGSPAHSQPRIRRWEGSLTLQREANGDSWQIANDPTSTAKIDDTFQGTQTIQIQLQANYQAFELQLSLDNSSSQPAFINGDYWLVLLRHNGQVLTAECLSELPEGNKHHYLAVGTVSINNRGEPVDFEMSEAQWRQWSFPSLTRLSLDRVLIENNNGDEIPMTDKFVAVEGDEMTGDLTVKADLHIEDNAAGPNRLSLSAGTSNSNVVSSNRVLEFQVDGTPSVQLTRESVDVNGHLFVSGNQVRAVFDELQFDWLPLSTGSDYMPFPVPSRDGATGFQLAAGALSSFIQPTLYMDDELSEYVEEFFSLLQVLTSQFESEVIDVLGAKSSYEKLTDAQFSFAMSARGLSNQNLDLLLGPARFVIDLAYGKEDNKEHLRGWTGLLISLARSAQLSLIDDASKVNSAAELLQLATSKYGQVMSVIELATGFAVPLAYPIPSIRLPPSPLEHAVFEVSFEVWLSGSGLVVLGIGSNANITPPPGCWQYIELQPARSEVWSVGVQKYIVKRRIRHPKDLFPERSARLWGASFFGYAEIHYVRVAARTVAEKDSVSAAPIEETVPRLQSLNLDLAGSSLSPAFSPETHHYTLVGKPESHFALLTQVPNDLQATVEANGVPLLSNQTSSIKVASWDSSIEIKVTSRTGRNANYTFDIAELRDQVYIKATNSDPGDLFGTSVALSEDILVVGAFGDDSSARGINSPGEDNIDAGNSGAVYVFRRHGSTWQEEAYIKASNTGATDWFGHCVAFWGDTLVVGAHGEDNNATGVNPDVQNNDDGNANYSGAVYVFRNDGPVWQQEAYIKASNTGAEDHFGYSVSLSGDTFVVGAPDEDNNAKGINPLDQNNDDGNANYSGAVYVFRRRGSVWEQEAYIKASNAGSFDYFGKCVALSGDTLVIGAIGEDNNATGINPDDQNNDDGNANESGAVYIFRRHGSTWRQEAYIKGANTGAGDHFGQSVAISGDTLVVGANNEDNNAMGINPQDQNNDDGGADNSGAVYVFRRQESAWSQEAYIKASNTGAGDFFGGSVVLLGDTLVVGASGENNNATGINPDNQNNDDGDANNSGAAYIFRRTGSTWRQEAYIKAANSGANDRFGHCVALSGSTLAVGANYEASNATGINSDQNNNEAIRSGAVYVM